MLARVRSGAPRGIDALVVVVEVDVSSGLPHTTTVGLPEQVVPAESASRHAFSGTDIAALGLLRVIDASLPCDGEEFAREAMACCDVTPSALAERRIVPEPPSGSRWRGEKGGIP